MTDIQRGEIEDAAVAALAGNHGMMDVGAGYAEDMPWVLSGSNASVNTHYSLLFSTLFNQYVKYPHSVRNENNILN